MRLSLLPIHRMRRMAYFLPRNAIEKTKSICFRARSPADRIIKGTKNIESYSFPLGLIGQMIEICGKLPQKQKPDAHLLSPMSTYDEHKIISLVFISSWEEGH